MKMRHNISKVLVISILVIGSHGILAQVGIGNPTPNASSILDLKNTNNKFLLLPAPTVTPSSIANFSTKPEDLLLYYSDKLYFKTSSGIKSITPWIFGGTATNGVYTSSGTMPVRISVQPSASSPAKLQIADAAGEVTQTSSNSSLMLGSASTGTHMMLDGDELLVKTSAIRAGTLELQEDGGSVSIRSASAGETTTVLSVGTSIDATGTGKLKENGNALVPAGTIVIWFGAAAGWAICDGTNGKPDLRGRFVVGADGTHPLNTIGGQASVTLSVAQMPAHSHNTTHGHSINGPGHTHGISLGDSGNSCTLDDDTGRYECAPQSDSNTTGIKVNDFAGNSGPVDSHSPMKTDRHIVLSITS